VPTATLPKLAEAGVSVTGMVTTSETVAELVRTPLVPVIVNVYVPPGVVADVVTFSVLVCAPLVMSTGFGVNVPFAPVGNPETDIVTFPVNPLLGVTVAVYEVPLPALTV